MYKRTRSKTMAFRMTPEEYEEIVMLADISGLQRQDYLITRALDKRMIVRPNVRVAKYLEQYLIKIQDELRKRPETECDDVLTRLRDILEVIAKL